MGSACKLENCKHCNKVKVYGLVCSQANENFKAGFDQNKKIALLTPIRRETVQRKIQRFKAH